VCSGVGDLVLPDSVPARRGDAAGGAVSAVAPSPPPLPERPVGGSTDSLRRLAGEPFYLPSANEVAVFEMCHRRELAVMLKGPTGCGKTRFVEHIA
jgi:hypothetical protein